MPKCFVCEKSLGNTYSLKLKKDGNCFHTCSYNCNMMMHEKFGSDFWEHTVNKTDFISPGFDKNNPFVIVSKEKNNDKNIFRLYDFENIDENEIMDGERYERQYKIYLENKAIDEIFENVSDVSSEYSYESD